MLSIAISEFKSDEELIGELMLTLASLTVRSEYCAVIEKAGGLNFVLEVMVWNSLIVCYYFHSP